MQLWPAAPRAFVGTSPWIGAGQFGERAHAYRARLHDRPEAMVAIVRRASELGWGVQAFCMPALLSALSTAREQGLDVPLVMACGMYDFEAELAACAGLQPKAVCLHAAVADGADQQTLDHYFERVEQTGAVPGAATHQPARTVPLLQDTACRLIMAPVNPVGLLMGRDPTAAREAIQASRIPVLAKKTLAAGRIDVREGLSHAVALGAAALAVGVTSLAELEEDHALVEQLWPAA